ncbi:hypothetical protein DFH09DRAFT_1339157 [Mycena vulgaris]|nr:hypothetical protein DFH09DRAFT_1339157 [Mycena vulgaris]
MRCYSRVKIYCLFVNPSGWGLIFLLVDFTRDSFAFKLQVHDRESAYWSSTICLSSMDYVPPANLRTFLLLLISHLWPSLSNGREASLVSPVFSPRTLSSVCLMSRGTFSSRAGECSSACPPAPCRLCASLTLTSLARLSLSPPPLAKPLSELAGCYLNLALISATNERRSFHPKCIVFYRSPTLL